MGIYPQKKARFYTYICRNMTHFRQSIRSQLSAYQYSYGHKTASGVCLQNVTDYSPFGVPLDGRTMQGDAYRYGFGSHEKIDEVSGSGNTVDMGDRWLDVRLGRTPKMDKHASKYPAITPYAYAVNNPLYYIDPDGKDIIPYGNGYDIQSYITQLQAATSLETRYNIETGRIDVFGEPVTEADKKLLEASTNKNVNVNIFLTKTPFIESRNGQKVILLGGSFEGSEVDDNGIVNTVQWINPEHMSLISKGGLAPEGASVLHETLESYIGAIDNPGFTPTVRLNPDGASSPEYNNAHNKSNELNMLSVEAFAEKVGTGIDFGFESVQAEKSIGIKMDLGGAVSNRNQLKNKTQELQEAIKTAIKIVEKL